MVKDNPEKLIVEGIKGKAEAPQDESNILKWTMPELNAYIKSNTKKMSIRKKMKFGQELIKRIEKAKKEAGIKK